MKLFFLFVILFGTTSHSYSTDVDDALSRYCSSHNYPCFSATVTTKMVGGKSNFSQTDLMETVYPNKTRIRINRGTAGEIVSIGDEIHMRMKGGKVQKIRRSSLKEKSKFFQQFFNQKTANDFYSYYDIKKSVAPVGHDGPGLIFIKFISKIMAPDMLFGIEKMTGRKVYSATFYKGKIISEINFKEAMVDGFSKPITSKTTYFMKDGSTVSGETNYSDVEINKNCGSHDIKFDF